MFVFILCSRLIPFSCFPFLVYYYSLVYSSSYSPDVLIEELSEAGISLYIYILEMISCINAHHRAIGMWENTFVAFVKQVILYLFIKSIVDFPICTTTMHTQWRKKYPQIQCRRIRWLPNKWFPHHECVCSNSLTKTRTLKNWATVK